MKISSIVLAFAAIAIPLISNTAHARMVLIAERTVMVPVEINSSTVSTFLVDFFIPRDGLAVKIPALHTWSVTGTDTLINNFEVDAVDRLLAEPGKEMASITITLWKILEGSGGKCFVKIREDFETEVRGIHLEYFATRTLPEISPENCQD